jgi:hypothetical protein
MKPISKVISKDLVKKDATISVGPGPTPRGVRPRYILINQDDDNDAISMDTTDDSKTEPGVSTVSALEDPPPPTFKPAPSKVLGSKDYISPLLRMTQRKGKITSQPREDQVLIAVQSLLNNRRRNFESKEPGLVTFDENILRLARGLFSPNKVYKFSMVTTNAIAATSGGVVNGYIDFPTVATSCLEWTALKALFQLCKLDAYKLSLVTATAPPSILTTAGPIPITMLMAYNPSDEFGGGVTLNEIVRLPKKIQFNGYLGSHGSGTVVFQGRAIPLLYAEVGDVATESPPAGIQGGINYVSYAVGTASAVYYDYYLNLMVSFKSRQ